MAIADPLEHAHRIIDVVRGGLVHATSDAVAHSWARCIQQHGLDPSQSRRPPVVGSGDLPTRQRRMAAVIDCARYEMTTLYQQLGDPELAVVLTDTDGVILHMVTSQEFERLAQPLGLEVGAVWSEAEVGTNGMGTCVAEAAPVVVQQADHFLSQYTGLTCSAVPIYDPAGQMTAVLDVSSSSVQPQKHLLLLLGMTARMIENRLIDIRFRDAHPIHFHSRPEFVYTLHEGRLVVDEGGRILAANHSAAMQLEMTHAELRGARLEQIFQTTLDDMLERSHRAGFHPIVTYRAHAANRFFAVARLPAREENAAGAARIAIPARNRIVPPPVVSALPRTRSALGTPAPTFGDPRLASHLATAQRVIAGRTPLLLRAETGAGKEVFARAVHAAGNRADGPFVAINCASLPETLIEAELFGYRAGAFTGAEKGGRRGKIVQSDGGTLFLDEIGDMPLPLQARLLRVLDERMVTPLGTDEVRPVDFQLISASHRNLAEMVAEGTFREDLFYRLAGIELQLPPLRERTDRAEIIRNLLVDEGRPDAALTPAAWDLLLRHPWPGNLRQLHHVLRSAVALAAGAPLGLEHFPSLGAPAALAPASSAPPVADGELLSPHQAKERQSLLNLLEAQRWNVSHVAKSLGVSRNTLYRRMHKLRIPVTHSG
ncbi:sigma-54-dependent transcriptional regulator EatR [Ramlibacter monticola]|uniref:Sigma-54-dependent Fis family transcriptional regulator n=1 Tax=Ramlibacter monticola TaxID=1926872 RepID=A0A936YZU0_9BURK|nr:sigma-54-dependent Fis family transcriptional regulator [Ramlibacter monticola]MBL0391604.1 sigma-54-dependent Fis family transcriptional regulator [Ramlibacter monticola]